MSSIWTPAPLAIAPPALFTAKDIAAYEKEILANSSATELDASRFFAQHPKFLHLGTGVEVRREVVLVDKSGKPKQRVDFFRRSYGSPFWDIIELKDPRKPFVVSPQGQHPRLSAEVGKAIDQALDYRDLIEQDGSIRTYLRDRGIWVCRPQMIVVAGRIDNDVPLDLLQVLYDRIRQRGPIEAWSYNDIHKFAKEHYKRNRLILVPALHLADSDVMNKNLAWEYLIERLSENPSGLYNLSPRDFDLLIAQIMEAFGFEVSLAPATQNQGYDFIAVQREALAQTKVLVECKRYSPHNKIGIELVRSMIGAIQVQGATGGIIATTSSFTKGAKALLDEERWRIQGKDIEAVHEWLERYRQRLRGRTDGLL